MWRLAGSLKTLLASVNATWPKRSKASDGTIGDAAHQARKSDHDPNERGVVCAMDITHDPSSGCDAGEIAEALRASKDPRIKYIIYNKRICSSTVSPWVWRPYAGLNEHKHHIHISVRDDVADDQPWTIKQ